MSQHTTDRSFDDLARALAEGSISRRRALKLFAGTAIAALIPSRALAQPKKTIICHKPGTPEEKTIEVSNSAVASHVRHGDRLGPCGTTTTTTTAAPTTTSTTSTSTSTSTTTPTTSTSTSTTSTSTTPMCIPDFEEGCTADTQCCSHICNPSGTTGVCSDCRLVGGSCTDGRECCFGVCENDICCNQREGDCNTANDCCGDLICDSLGTCVPPPP